MKEYMLLIRNRINHQADWTEDKTRDFLKKCEVYIGELKREGKLISAQPLIREGKIVAGSEGKWKEIPFSQSDSDEVQVGYYHILANDMDDAIKIARRNPEFEFGTTARIEVRQVKAKEHDTGFVYPKED